MVLFDEEDANLLKKWIVKRLEDISDADADVLADYVLALLRHDQTESEVKQMCEEQLLDFLRDHTKQFVNDVFHVIRTKSYLSVNSTLIGGGLRPSTPPQGQEQDQGLPYSPTQSHSKLESPTTRKPRSPNQARQTSKKRSHGYIDRDAPGFEHDSQPLSRSRGSKQARQHRGDLAGTKWSRGGGGGEHQGHDRNNGRKSTTQPGSANPFPGVPLNTSIPGMPWGADPMSQFLAAQAAIASATAAGIWPMLPFGLPPQPQPTISTSPIAARSRRRSSSSDSRPKKIFERCKDYEDKGFCMQGDMCPYEHGQDHIVVGDNEEYDPKTSLLSPQLLSPVQEKHENGFNKTRTKSYTRSNRGGRSSLSSAGPSYDKQNTSLVVENIPADKLDQGSVNEFFSEFGEIDSISFKPNRSLAIVKFTSYESAKAAYSSPAPIFDNRFVKVFWQRTENVEDNDHKRSHVDIVPIPEVSDAMDIDMEEFAKKQEEAQKVFNEKQAKKKAIEDAAKDLEKRKEELRLKQEEQKKLLLEKLAKKHGATSATSAKAQTNGTTTTTSKEAAEAQKTAALRAQLEALEAEAASLGIDHAQLDQPLSEHYSYPPNTYRGRGRGRAAYSRGGYAPRGRGAPYAPYTPYAPYPPYRGGRGGALARGGGGNAFKLDNRTKKITISGITHEHDEGLRQHLLHTGEFESLEPNPTIPNAQVVTFRDRHTAEAFFYSGSTIPGIGKVELSWYNPPTTTTTNNNILAKTASKPSSSATNTPTHEVIINTEHDHDVELDEYDVADDDEGRWE